MTILKLTVLPPGKEPLPEHEQFSNDEKRTKYRFVASGQPKRQVDVEVIGALICVAICQISQRATAPVYREDGALNQYQPCEEGRPTKLSRVPAKGIATMHPAMKSQIAVCRSFIPIKTGIRYDWGFTRNPS
ncbi:MAG TPA: hypothetical protein VFO27_16465 [Bryobacteraceae bacterium]|nr:hypothetical protein [Bryobacteraceae bacterium]